LAKDNKTVAQKPKSSLAAFISIINIPLLWLPEF